MKSFLTFIKCTLQNRHFEKRVLWGTFDYKEIKHFRADENVKKEVKSYMIYYNYYRTNGSKM